MPAAITRREYLRRIGLLAGAATLAACRPVKDISMEKLPLIADFDIQARIRDAVENGSGLLDIPKGEYRLGRPLLIHDVENFIIEGNGSRIVYTFADNPRVPVTFATILQSCRNVTLRNLTIDFDPLPWTQGTISAVGPDGVWVDMRVHAGYRSDAEFFAQDIQRGDLSLHLFDPKTNKLKVGSSFLFPNIVSVVKKGVLRFTLKYPDPEKQHFMVKGDTIATATWRAMAFALRNTEGTRLENITIWCSGGAAISEINGGGGTDLQIQITPGPRPKGAKVNRVWSASRDGYHCSGLRKGPQVHDSLFDSLGDDAINIFTPVIQILEVNTKERYVNAAAVDGRALSSLASGDELVIYRPENITEKARTRITEALPAGHLKLETADGIAVGDLAFSPAIAARGTTVRDSTFRNMDAGAITVKAIDAVIQNNTIDHIGISGIELAVYLSTYFEGTFASNAVVENNTVRDIGFSALVTRGDWRLNGGIAVGFAQVPDPSILRGNREFKNITIAGNTIEKTALVGLFISNASDMLVRNNRIATANQAPPPPGNGNWWGTPIPASIAVFESEKVIFMNTIVAEPGIHGQTDVFVDPSCDLASIDTSGIQREE